MKVLMLGTAKESKEIILKARELGYYTIVTDYLEPEKSRAKLVSDEYWMLSTGDLDALEKKCKEEHIDAVITGISTFNIKASMELCKRLNLPCYANPEAWSYTIDKRRFKDICKENCVPVAEDYFLSEIPTEKELTKIKYPVVVKAIDQSANRGMSYCKNAGEVIEAIKYAQSFSESTITIVEHMLQGHEYAARYAMADGEASLVNFSLMINQPGYPSNCYSITTTCTDKFKTYLKTFDPYFKKALKAMGCKEGYAWVELMADVDGSLNALEMGYRMAGDMFENQMAKAGHFDAINWLLEVATGVKHTPENLPIPLDNLPNRIVTSYILWSKSAGMVSRIEGIDEISSIPNITIQQDVFVGSTFRKHQYLFVITFDNANASDMCKTIQKINDKVRIYDGDGNNVVIYYDDFQTLIDINKKGDEE